MTNLTALSVLDTQWPARVPALAPALEQLGYRRLWLSEHHARGQSGSPLVLSAAVGATTTRLRVGPAGVLLRYTSPARVAADAAVLELLYPGRIDLGLANAAAHPPVHAALMDGRDDDGGVRFEMRSDEVLLDVGAWHDRGAAGARDAVPMGPTTLAPPAIWICGQSHRYASYAAARSVHFAFHHFLAQVRGQSGGPDCLERYRDQFVLPPHTDVPEPVVVCYGSCATSEREARLQWQSLFGTLATANAPNPRAVHADGLQRPSFLGTPAQCAEQLRALATWYDTTELVVQCFAMTGREVSEGYALLADALLTAEATTYAGVDGFGNEATQLL